MLSKTNWPYNAVLRAAAAIWEESHMRKETISLSSDTDHQTRLLSLSRRAGLSLMIKRQHNETGPRGPLC